MSKKKNNAAPAAGPKRRTGSSLPAALLLLCLGLAGCLFILQQSLTRDEQQHDRELVQARATSLLTILEHITSFINDDSQTIARDPILLHSIRQQDLEQISRIEQQLARRAYLVDAVISIPGQPLSPTTRKAPINYAALDHIGKAATNQSAAPELLRADGKSFFYKAVPILDAQLPGRVPGTLMLIYDADLMLQHIQPADDGRHWHIQGIQQLPGAPAVTLFEQGTATSQPVSRFAGMHPYWSVELAVEPLALASLPILLPALMGVAGLFITALLALLLLQSSHQRKLRHDKDLLVRAMLEHPSSAALLLEGLQQNSHRQLTAPLLELLQKANRTSTAAKPAQSVETEPAAVEQAPTHSDSASPFAASDALDIDILDLDLDENALNAGPSFSPAPTIEPGIFRAYDIRGIVGQDINAETAYWIGRAVGSESLARGEQRVVTGRDGRLSGPELHEGLIQGLLESGCDVLDLGMVPTPLVYFGTHQLGATSGVMLTGSHNPANYNGFKIVIAGQTLADQQITALYQRIIEQNLSSGLGQREQVELLPRYVRHIADDVAAGKPLRVVVDCGNGVAGVVAPQLLEEIGCSVIPLYCEVDGSFPNHHPDPGKPENLQDLIRKVQEEQADLGLAFDGDGDRLGVVTNQGEIIYPDRLMMLLAKDILSRQPGADIIFDVKCSRRLGALISRCGGRPIMWKTGHSLMKAKMQETGALLGGEMSGHIYFGERWFGFDDGIYAAARLLEILSMEARSAHQVFAQYQTGIATPELNIEVSEDSKFQIIQSLQSSADWGDASVNSLDGIRVDFPAGWGLIRASNTTPMLVLRFEGDTPDELQRIQNLFREQLLAVAPNLHWPFS